MRVTAVANAGEVGADFTSFIVMSVGAAPESILIVLLGFPKQRGEPPVTNPWCFTPPAPLDTTSPVPLQVAAAGSVTRLALVDRSPFASASVPLTVREPLDVAPTLLKLTPALLSIASEVTDAGKPVPVTCGAAPL